MPFVLSGMMVLIWAVLTRKNSSVRCKLCCLFYTSSYNTSLNSPLWFTPICTVKVTAICTFCISLKQMPSGAVLDRSHSFLNYVSMKLLYKCGMGKNLSTCKVPMHSRNVATATFKEQLFNVWHLVVKLGTTSLVWSCACFQTSFIIGNIQAKNNQGSNTQCN